LRSSARSACNWRCCSCTVGYALLALIELITQPIECGALLVVLGREASQGFAQGRHIQRTALGSQRLASAIGVQALLVQVFDLGALHLRRRAWPRPAALA
jgi:hypothetical protein